MKGLKEQQEKRIIYLAILLFAVVVVALFVLSQTFFSEGENTENSLTPQRGLVARDINIDFNILKNDFLDEVQKFERISYPEIEIGRENPFIVY